MIKNSLFLLLGFLCFLRPVAAQVITVEPAFPKATDAVTITFDATKGAGGLANCNCDVYLHTGVITGASTGSSDWKYVVTTWGVANAAWKMERVTGQNNLYRYTIAPSIRQYYKVPDGETIQRMAFVFRDATGRREGKDSGGRDIFYDVFSETIPFSATLQSPSQKNLVVSAGQTIPIRMITSADATITVTDNGTQLTQVQGRALSFDLMANQAGTHLVQIVARSGQEEQSFSFNYVIPLNLPQADPAAALEPGITLVGDTLLRLLLYAPGKKHVFLLGDFTEWNLDTRFQLRQTTDGNSFWIEVGGLQPGQYYRFQYLVDGEILIADPFSKLVLDPAHDPFIPAETFPDLPPYPTGKTTGILTLIQPGAPEYKWAVEDFQRPPQEKLVIYELLLRDFIARHDYTTLIDSLEYLSRLGINALQLMPVQEFEGNISWGYNPSFHLALDKYYGPINEFKRLVDSCHARGIAVIIDVVYNHAFGQSPLANLYWNSQLNQPAADNPWLNPTARHPFNVGYDFNHESQATRVYVEKAIQYWLEEFRVDGYRFDLSKGFTQTPSTNDDQMRRYDPSRVAILKRYADLVWSTTPGAYVILEHFADDAENRELAEYGAMHWAGAGLHNQYLEAAMGYSSNLSDASYRNRGWTKPHLVTYMESHDEERMVYKNLNFSASGPGYNIRELPVALARVELASAFFFTIPGPKMIWQFGELGYDFSINYCANGSINNACRTDPKPIRWDYQQNPNRQKVYEVMADLIHLKTQYEAFNTTDFSLNVAQRDFKTIFLRHSSMNVAVQGNFSVGPISISNPFPSAGAWYEYFSGDSINISNPATPITLQAGEYRLYTTRRIQRPGQVSTSRPELVRNQFQLRVYPNPAAASFNVNYRLETAAVVGLEVYDWLGRRLAQPMAWQRQGAGEYSLPLDLNLPAGNYLLRLQVGQQVETTRLTIAY